MYAIYGNMYHQYTPVMLAYIPAPWILWVYTYIYIKIYSPIPKSSATFLRPIFLVQEDRVHEDFAAISISCRRRYPQRGPANQRKRVI